MGVVGGGQRSKDGVERVQQGFFDLETALGIPLGELQKIIHVDAGVGQGFLEPWPNKFRCWRRRDQRCRRRRLFRGRRFREGVQPVGTVVEALSERCVRGIGCRLCRGAKRRRGFCPPPREYQGNSNEGFHALWSRKENC